jgi:hypothetical protein
MPRVILGLKGPLFLLLNISPPLLAGAQTALRIAVNKLVIEVIDKLNLSFIRACFKKDAKNVKKYRSTSGHRF